MASVDQEKNGQNSWPNTRKLANSIKLTAHTFLLITELLMLELGRCWNRDFCPAVLYCVAYDINQVSGVFMFHHKKGMKTVKFLWSSCSVLTLHEILFFTNAQISSLNFLSITERNCYYPECSSKFRCIRVMCCNLTFIVLRFHDLTQTRAWSDKLRPDRHNEIF